MDTEKEKPAPEQKEKSPDVQFTPEELDEIAKAIFGPRASLVNRAAFVVTRALTGDEELSKRQLILLAPANAFESLVRMGVGLFTGETYSDLAEFVDTIRDPARRKVLMEILKKGWENCTQGERDAFVIEIISAGLISVGTLSKLKGIIPAEKLKALNDFVAMRHLANIGSAIAATPADEMATASGPVIADAMKKLEKNK